MSKTVDKAAVEKKLNEFIKRILKLGDDVTIDSNASLIDQIGLDSIEAFDAVATLHEIMGVSIPDDFNPKVVASLNALATFICDSYSPSEIALLVEADFDQLEADWGADA